MPTSQLTASGPEVLSFHLQRHAEVMPNGRALTFLADGESVESELTYGQLHDRAAQVASRLSEAGLAGEAVILFHPPGREFVIAFCGCLMAGVIAVPLQPPTTRRLLDRAEAVFTDCSAAAILTTTAGLAGLESMAAARGLPLIATDAPAGIRSEQPHAVVLPSSPAVLQYTSGSTGSPKGVVITQGNLVANSALIAAAFGTRPGDVGVNWLPLLHDMGLIGSVVHVIHHGIHCVHMSPQAMIRNPLRWLRAVSSYRATISGGPDFAWRLLSERVRPADIAGLDLSSWRVAYTGAEPVRSSTLDRAGDLLAEAGFRREAFLPCYGMAEATLIVSGGPAGAEPVVARPAGADPQSGGYVGCGRPVPSGSVAIVDPAACTRRPDGHEGEVWVTGPHVSAGYWGKEDLSEECFRAHLPCDPRPWLRTGDLGFMRDGQLFISGRIKDLLIVNGRKHHPEDIEASIQNFVEACSGGSAAAFQAEVGGNQRLVIAVELPRLPDDETMTRIADEVRACVWCHHEVLADHVVAVRIGRLPRTTSGKVRRAATAAAWMSGTLSHGAEHA